MAASVGRGRSGRPTGTGDGVTAQRPLVEVAATPVLTARQQAAWDLVRGTAGGCTAEEVGYHLHTLKGKHGVATTCTYCASEGLSVLRSKALRPLVIRRRTGLWEPREKADRTVDRGAQTNEIPW
jgi:hypothetical protein